MVCIVHAFQCETYKNVNANFERFPQISPFKDISNEGKDRGSILSSTTPDPGYQWESDNITIRHHKREPRGQPFPSR